MIIIGPSFIFFIFLLILCRSCAQGRHGLHSRGAVQPWGRRQKAKSSSISAGPPAVSSAAAQRPIYSPALWSCRLVTAVCNNHRMFRFFFYFCSNMWAATEMLIERHLEDILNNNRQAVIATFQTEIKNTLKTQNRRKKASKVSCCKEIHIVHFMMIILIVFYVDSFELSVHMCFARIRRSCFLPPRSSSVLVSVLWAAAVISNSEMPVWTSWRCEKNNNTFIYITCKCRFSHSQGCFTKTEYSS